MPKPQYSIAKQHVGDIIPLRLHLITVGGGISLVHVDERGVVEHWLMELTTDGKLYRYSSIPETFGLSLDSGGRINLVD